jgi:putative NIF3 family GTP cyclohydrolase 1 type 2
MTDWLAEGLAGGARELARAAALRPLRPASAALPSPGAGAGRLLELRRDEPLPVIAARLRRFLGAPRIDAVVAGARHRRIAICPGAGASFLPDAAAHGATLLVTGEARHHEQLAARAVGVSMLLAGHTWTERGCMPRLARALSSALAGPTFTVASSDLPPLTDPIARPSTARGARRPARPR